MFLLPGQLFTKPLRHHKKTPPRIDQKDAKRKTSYSFIYNQLTERIYYFIYLFILLYSSKKNIKKLDYILKIKIFALFIISRFTAIFYFSSSKLPYSYYLTLRQSSKRLPLKSTIYHQKLLFGYHLGG